jgi:uncharacterized membrane protein
MGTLMETRNGLKLTGHPVHAALTHFPMAFLMVVFPLEAAGWLGWDMGWQLAWWAEAAGLLSAVPAAFTGLFDLAALTGPKLSALANRHMAVMLGTVSAFGLGMFLKGGPQPVGQGPGGPSPLSGPEAIITLGLSLIGLLLLVWGGWLGGEMVFRHGAAQNPKT